MTNIKQQLQRIIDQKTKPPGSLGRLEALALQIGLVQGTVSPELKNPHLLVFAADHGAASEGLSAYPTEVTAQMVRNFLAGGAAINVFCRQHGLGLKVIDAGVKAELPLHPGLIDHKIGFGTRNYLKGAAMTVPQLQACFEKSAGLVRQLSAEGCNVLGFGEMGIGNTASASLLMSRLTGLPLERCTGRGTGLNDEQLYHKLMALKKAARIHQQATTAEEALAAFGGFEIAQMCGAMLEAHRQGILLLVDGFIATAAFLAASHLQPNIQRNAVFCHQSDEYGHHYLLKYLQARPLLQLGLRLGEGTGCALAWPLLQSAVAFLNEMASFDSAGVSGG